MMDEAKRSVAPDGHDQNRTRPPQHDESLGTKGSDRDVQDEENNIDSDGSPIERHLSGASSVWASQKMSFPREMLFVAIVCLTQFCNQAASSITLFLINKIGQDLDVANPAFLGWLPAGFSLTAGTFLLLSGRLGDAFGYKLMLIIGFFWFAVWSVIAGVALYSGYTLFVFARVMQGIGSAICIPNALAALGAAYPHGHRKAMVFAFFGAAAPVGALTGAICATALNLLWWPWAFFALAIVLFILMVVTQFVVPSSTPAARKRSPDGRLQNSLVVELDLLGGTTGVTALILFNFAWNQAPIAGWNSAEVIVTLILGLALFALFLWIEKRYAKNPLVPFDALNADVLFVLGTIACGWSMFGIWVLYIVQVFENVRHLSPLLTSLWCSPILITGLVASVTTGKLLGPLKFTPATVMTIAMVAFTVGIVLFTTTPVDQIYWGQTFVSVLVIPFGMDMSFPAATLILSNAVKKEHQGIAASLVATVVNYSISLGIGFAGTVDVHTNNGGKTTADVYKGYKNALWLAVGLAASGLVVSLVFLAREKRRTGPQEERAPDEGKSGNPGNREL